MQNKKSVLSIGLILLLPWVYVFFSVYAEKIGIEDFIPPNKCIEIAKLQINEDEIFSNPYELKDMKKESRVREDLLIANFHLERFPSWEIFLDKKNKSKDTSENCIKNILVVGDSIGEGLFLAFKKYFRKKLNCINVKFLVKRSTATFHWLKDKTFLNNLRKNKYDVIIVSLGANQWNTDKLNLYYHIGKFYLKVHSLSPNSKLYWIVPAVKSKYLRRYVEYFVGSDNTIAIEDYTKIIPLSKDKVHLNMKKHGYVKLWNIILNKIGENSILSCKK